MYISQYQVDVYLASRFLMFLQVSESLVVNHGDFLIRDSQSSLGDFVLTSHWEQKTLHFVIRKTVVQSSETYTRVQYSLEDEAFESLPALVHFYVGGRAALTRWSGAQIHRPVNRTLPLSYLETAFCTAVSPPSCHKGLMNGEERVCPRRWGFTQNLLEHRGFVRVSEIMLPPYIYTSTPLKVVVI